MSVDPLPVPEQPGWSVGRGEGNPNADQLRDAGIDPYPYAFERTHSIEELQRDFSDLLPAETRVAVASRVIAHRSAGKTLVFLDLAPTANAIRQGHKIQVMVRRDQLDSASLPVLDVLSTGDWIGVEGTCMRTDAGEPTIRAQRVAMLSKSLRSINFPKNKKSGSEARVGIQDPETRWRYPELDMLVGHKAEVLAARSRVLRSVREVLSDQYGCIEIETPYLNICFGGADARPFVTEVFALDCQQVFLAISPELELKRAVVGGLGSGGALGNGVFSIARNFRNEGIDRTHNPEFTVMEVYVPFVDYTFMMQMTEDLYRQACLAVNGSTQCTFRGRTLDFGQPWPRLPMVDLVKEKSGIDVGQCTVEQIREVIRDRGLDTGGEIARALSPSASPLEPPDLLAILQRAAIARLYPELHGAPAAELRATAERHRLPIGVDLTLEWDFLVLELFDMFCEPLLWEPCHVTLHPAKSTVLCKRARGGPLPNGQELIERFESFGAGMELSNAYSELNDPVLQRALIVEQAAQRMAGKDDAMPHNERFIRSVEMGLPPCGGLGVGIDRMMMLLKDCHTIREVIAFPMTRDAEAEDP